MLNVNETKTVFIEITVDGRLRHTLVDMLHDIERYAQFYSVDEVGTKYYNSG
jgi:hypothetical protein